MTRRRLDAALVERGLARSRGVAVEVIRSGGVRVNDVVVDRPSRLVGAEDDLQVSGGGPAWVSRAADKLQTAFDVFGAIGPDPWTVVGKSCVDVGASTGGFTQVLLRHGAAEVVALDVGHDQLAEPLRADPRVREVSGRSVRGIEASSIGGPFPALVADLSFISLRLVAADLAGLLADPGNGVLLVKPQFEVGRGGLGKNGVVKDPRARARAVRGVLDACRDVHLFPRCVAPTRVPGHMGNQEYLVWVTTQADFALPDHEAAAADAVRTGEGRR